jgi:hypothetical protein
MLIPDREPNPPYSVDLEFPEDPAAILTNIYRVTNMLVRGQIDRPTANSVTYGMQVCLSALNGKPLFDPATAAPSRAHDSGDDSEESNGSESSTPLSRPVHRVILTPDGDEIAPPVQILEDNEAEPIHHKGCPCLECAEKFRNQPPEEHHANCQCGLCEEHDEGTEHREQGSEQNAEHSAQLSAPPSNDVILSESLNESVSFRSCHPERSEPGSPARQVLARWGGEAESRELLLVRNGTSDDVSTRTLSPELCVLSPRRTRIARASSLLSGSSSRDPLNRPWSVAEYTFGDAIRRHEAQYAARAAAALAVGIEPPPYEPFTTGLILPGQPDYEEDQQMQQHSSEYWAAHFRKLIAERPDIQQYLADEEAAGSAADAGTSNDASAPAFA